MMMPIWRTMVNTVANTVNTVTNTAVTTVFTILLALTALPLLAETDAADPGSSGADNEAGEIFHVQVDSIIHPVVAQFLAETLDEADEENAEALIIELSTPGGLLTSTRTIFKDMLAAQTPVVVFVGPSGSQAASAGFFILMASDVAAMAPSTNTGSAHPVAGQGQDIQGDMGDKVEQDAAAAIRSLASQHGRDVALAEAAVLESHSYSAEEALENGLIEIIAADVNDLVRQLDGRQISKLGNEITLNTAEARVVKREMAPFQAFLAVIAHPEIAYILMALGFLGLYTEFSNPGGILPGVAGAICLLVGFFALSVLPVNYAGLALILLALVLFIAEVMVMSHGLLSLAGIVALVLGSTMLFKDADPALNLSFQFILTVLTPIVLVMLALLYRAFQVRQTPVTTGSEGMIHELGVARTAIDPNGKVFIHGELWRAEAEEPVAEGAQVEVLAVDGLLLRVRPVARPVSKASITETP